VLEYYKGCAIYYIVQFRAFLHERFKLLITFKALDLLDGRLVVLAGSKVATNIILVVIVGGGKVSIIGRSRDFEYLAEDVRRRVGAQGA
jgi:hypothetical protein